MSSPGAGSGRVIEDQVRVRVRVRVQCAPTISKCLTGVDWTGLD